ncbi:MAG: helix-turn-helix transcriptional regulator [Anaerolineae bacterium]|nr:helix-turn-helix transcriptional regulator [Anaerolineae bacterium]
MDHVDLTQAALEGLQSSPSSATATQNQAEAHNLRVRIIGVLIRRGRLSAERSVDDCASFLQVDAQLIEAWELGESVPSLPQLEGLTRFLLATADGEDAESAEVNFARGAEYYLLRQRMIGAKLKLARQMQAFALEELGARTGLDIDLIERYEFGEVKIPIHHLCVLAQAVRQDLRYFLSSDDLQRGQDLPPGEGAPQAPADSDLVRFAADDNNQAFIRLAMAFRQINREDLHRIAEALYNIINEKRDANGRSPATA